LGHVYQQRYKSFPIQDDDHFFVVCRYLERNALRAGLVERVNQPLSDRELEAVRLSTQRGKPWGDEAIGLLCSQLEKQKRQVMVVMEGTGGYEYLFVKHLASHKIEAAVINPRRVRDFAKGIGLDAKTDPIDAKVISKYAQAVVPKPMATKSEHELKHGALVARRNQLLELINQENNRLKQSWDDDGKQSIRDVLEMLKKGPSRSSVGR
jgi:hypothetical protein